MKNRKIEISNAGRILIVAALIAYGSPNYANQINELFEQADPANDGPEVAILSVEP